MNRYFPKEQSIGYRIGTETTSVLKTIAHRFVYENPPASALYCVRSQRNFSISEDYMEEIAFHQLYQTMEPEEYAYAWTRLTPPQAGPFHFRFAAWGPVSIYVNGQLAYRTNHVVERFPDNITDICLDLEAGENSLIFQCISTPLGCGFRIGSSSYKGRRIQFFGPDQERWGMSGMIYSGPFKRPLEKLPSLRQLEKDTGISWYPSLSWQGEDTAKKPGHRIFGTAKSYQFLSVTAIHTYTAGDVTVSGDAENDTLFLAGGRTYTIKKGTYTCSVFLPGGRHCLAFYGGDVTAKITEQDGEEIPLISPVKLAEGIDTVWLYAGLFEELPDLDTLLDFTKPFQTISGMDYWRIDAPDTRLRPMNEGVLYGEWSYPLGVTLYGMIQSARLLKDSMLTAYVRGHMEKCASFYEYCLWDKSVYGAAPFHNQLTTVDSLDDCGSFASAMLEVMKDYNLPAGEEITDMVAKYIEELQLRLPDGTFYRDKSYLPVMNETMWADDMYMSIPFLCRYYLKSQDMRYLEDAVLQAEHFYQYLYLPQQQIMSHIYDTGYQLQTKVPWGRGNGWVLFSLTELLAVLPDTHQKKQKLIGIFRQLSEGYLRLQDTSGMWHQVLTMPDSYEETSCTAMFVYGFARGVRYGWYENPPHYAKAAGKGWQALCDRAVDWKGNIYGVCRGSGYSFSKEYYAHDLSWNINDTHGTGIVMLAGIEVEKMKAKEKQDYE